VEFPALDSVLHVNNARYAAFLEQDLLDALAAHGWDVDPTGRDGHLRPARLDLEYYEPAFYRDRIDGYLWVTATGKSDFTCEYALHRGAQRLLHAGSRWQWTGPELPAELRRALARLAVP
jgi:acyl-CoA thioesterase FadM